MRVWVSLGDMLQQGSALLTCCCNMQVVLKFDMGTLCVMRQGLQVQALTRERSSQGQAGPVQPNGQLKHVLGVQNLGVGASSTSQQATLLCTGSAMPSL